MIELSVFDQNLLTLIKIDSTLLKKTKNPCTTELLVHTSGLTSTKQDWFYLKCVFLANLQNLQ